MKIDVLIADDFPLIRNALVDAIDRDPDISVVAAATNGVEAVELAVRHRPHVVLMDVHMPEMSGLVALERIRAQVPDARVVMLTATEKADVFLEAIASGAAGYLNKRVGTKELVQAVITVHGGGSVISPELAGLLLNEYSCARKGTPGAVRPLLAEREQQVLRLVALGHTDREIGSQLYISPRTVQNHLTRIRQKTGLQRRSELARWAADHARI
jgi:two-component system, NarL family, nitrate/nitrite response regulator NarL